MQCEFDSKNSIYLNKLIKEENVQLKKFPKDVLETFKLKTNEVLGEMIEKDPKSKKIFSPDNADSNVEPGDTLIASSSLSFIIKDTSS